MRRLAPAPAIIALLALLWPGASPPAVAAALEVAIVSPPAGEAVFGEVEVVAQVRPPGTAVAKVEFYLDGRRIGVVERPPYRVVVDVGQRNASRHFEVIAFDGSGARASASLRTPAVQTDLEISVDLQQLYVTVERAGRPVLSLERGAFTVVDEGARQEIVTFERGDVPFTAAMLLDASSSMRGGRLEAAVLGAQAFAGAMNRLDEAKLVLFSDRMLLETPFTGVPSILTLGLSEVEAGGGTALNDALYVALKRLEARPGRRVAVVLSDGIDLESVVPMERVRDVARSGQVVLYWLRLKRKGEAEGPVRRYSGWRGAEEHQRELATLEATVVESGGRIVPIDGVEEVEAALTAILTELRNQYVIGYYPSRSRGAGAWHDLEVKVGGPGFTVRAPKGYVER